MNSTAIDRLRSLRVADAMNAHVVSVGADQTLAEAAQTFAAHGIAAAPVVDLQGRCVGVFSLADLLKTWENADFLRFPGQAAVADCMTRPVHAVRPDASLLSAAALMDEKHVHRLPVLDDQGRVAGVLSTMDIVAALLHVVEEVDASMLEEIRRERQKPSA